MTYLQTLADSGRMPNIKREFHIFQNQEDAQVPTDTHDVYRAKFYTKSI